MINEAFTLVYTYHLYLFTDFMSNLEFRARVGNFLIFVAILNIIVNFTLVGGRIFRAGTRRLKMLYLKSKMKNNISLR